ncbi:hypothetical protein [Thalassotalea marina]|uniref:Uncharacterized protein n=1 Tax=Thalassotalea marina TaxID=1673741 RepID=A0A919BRN3_9GAMM|nr:hypothetical protein [Thalassotalea marina]GHG07911.1 hypothetical protein GCM10017161_42110 [Thalassotalea marina]
MEILEKIKANIYQEYSFINVHLSNKDISTKELVFYLKLFSVLIIISSKGTKSQIDLLSKLKSHSNQPGLKNRLYAKLARNLLSEISYSSKRLSCKLLDHKLNNGPPLIVDNIHTTGSIEFTIALGALLSTEILSKVDVKDIINLVCEYFKSLVIIKNNEKVATAYFDENTLSLIKEYDEVKIEFLNKDGSGVSFDLRKK